MAWITKKTTSKGETRYLVGWREPDGTRKHESRRTKAEADRLKRQVETQIDHGEYVPKSNREVPLATYISDLIASDESLGAMRGSTAYGYRKDLKVHIAPVLGNRPIGNITTDQLRKFFGDLECGPSAKAKVYRLLAKAFNTAFKEGRLPRSPLKAIARPKEPRTEKSLPTLDDVAAIADAADPAYRVPILVAAFTGLRSGEIGGLRLQDVDFEGRKINVRQAVRTEGGQRVIGELKTDKSRRTIPVGSLTEEIARHIELFPPADDGRIFTTNGHKGIVTHGTMNKAVHAAAKRAGVEPAPNAHLLRHFTASLLIRAGANVKQVQKFMGHATAKETLDTYADLWPEDLDELAVITDRARLQVTTAPQLVEVS
jgi:integrase